MRQFKATWNRIAVALSNDSEFLRYFGRTTGTEIDYAAKAGSVYDSGVVSIGLNKLSLLFAEAPMIVQAETKDALGGSDSTAWKEIPGHPLVKAAENPNPYYDDYALWFGIVLSLIVNGNAYWYKLRDRLGRVAGFYYLPHFAVRADNSDNNESKTKLITGYIYSGDGSEQKIAVEDIIHFRFGIDPADMRYGLSPLGGVLRDVVGDNAAGNYAAALLENFGVLSLLVSPKSEDGGEITSDQLKAVEKKLKDAGLGSSAGSIVALGLPTDVKEMGATPEKMALESLRKVPVERVLGAMGIDPMVVGLESSSKTYSNYKEALEACVRYTVIPLKKIIAKQIKRQCLDLDFKEEKNRVAWDYSEVWVLQDDLNELWKTGSAAYMAGVAMRSDVRRLLNLPVKPEDDVYYTDITMGLDAAKSSAKTEMQKAMRRYQTNFESVQEHHADSD